MATELAKAYVQIIPSAEGISGSISNVLSGEASSAGDAAGQTIGMNLVSTLKKVVAAAGLGALVKEALTAGGDLQQSIGGIETLFGAGGAQSVEEYAESVGKSVAEVSDTFDTLKASEERMLAYADEAYATAGLSANDYMQTVSSFAASLKQSTGDDMEALTTAANQAVIDMADNANKMGTSMESIQNAYQGFAKGNYTMLDNLKLGYGGTKTEMERLLADAEEISGVHYDLDNLDEVYSAIHVIQDELGITGTTAKEAASTLQGSMASMKSAFTNVLANLTTGGDVKTAMSNLIDSATTFVIGNLAPMAGNLLSALPTVVNGLMQGIMRLFRSASSDVGGLVDIAVNMVTGITSSIITLLPYVMEAAVDIALALGQGLLEFDWVGTAQGLISRLSNDLDLAAGEILGADGDIIGALLTAIQNSLPEVLTQGIEIITNLVNGILSNLPEIMTVAGDLIITFLDAILSMLPDVLESGVQLLVNIVQGIVDNLPEIVTTAITIIGKIRDTIGAHLPEILQTGVELLGQLIAGIINAIPKLLIALPKVLSAIKTTFGDYDWKSIGANILEGIKNGILGAVESVVEAAKGAASSIFEAVKGFFEIGSPSRLMARDIGKWIPAGIAVGIMDNMAVMQDAVDEMGISTMSNLYGAVQSGLSAGNIALAGSGQNNASGYTQNITINSPKQLSPSEVARQTRNATRNMVLAMSGV